MVDRDKDGLNDNLENFAFIAKVIAPFFLMTIWLALAFFPVEFENKATAHAGLFTASLALFNTTTRKKD